MFIAEPLVPRSRAPGIIFLAEDCREGTRRSEAGEEVKERDFFSTFLFRFCFATRQFNWGGEYILVAVACCWKVFF